MISVNKFARVLKSFVVILLLICFSFTSVPAHESADSENASVVTELSALAASIERLTSVLESQPGAGDKDLLYQKLNLAIAYLNFRSRRIEALEQDVQATRSAKAQIESTLNVWLERQQEMSASDSGLASEEARQRNDDVQMRIDLVKERLERLDSEIVNLESKIYELQGQIDSVEEFVQKNLAL